MPTKHKKYYARIEAHLAEDYQRLTGEKLEV